MTEALVLSFFAGLAIVVGALIAVVERIRPNWLERELRHAVIAFGGGALLAAVALVMVPEGVKQLTVAAASGSFVAGSICFLFADRLVQKRGGSAAQLMAMLLDYVPEAVAMGASFASGSPSGPLLAFLIGLQNLPEGFNSYREIMASAHGSCRKTLVSFALLSLLGPVAALTGIVVLAERPVYLAALMMFCAGGILYLTFQDIAPQAKLKRHWAPSLGAAGGFVLGVIGRMLITGAVHN